MKKEKIEYKALAVKVRERITEAIRTSGMTQSEIARSVGITSATLSDYIHKNTLPSIIVLAKLCEVLNISSDYILGLED